MSPYIVTTKRQEAVFREGIGRTELEVVSHRAVATLEEAHRAACSACRALSLPDDELLDAYNAASLTPESGGTVGPLPDGTVIEVERVTWEGLGYRWATPNTDGEEARRQHVLGAFNARHAGAAADRVGGGEAAD